MTWELCTDLTGRYFSIFLTDDMGIFGQIWQESWDFQENTEVQDGKWQVMRWEDEFTTGDGTSKSDGKWQVMRWEDEFTISQDGTSKMGSGRLWDRKTNLPHDMGLPRCRPQLRAGGQTAARQISQNETQWGQPCGGTTVGTAEQERDTEEYETGGEKIRWRNVWCALWLCTGRSCNSIYEVQIHQILSLALLSSCKVFTYIYDAYTHIYTHI